MDELGFGEMSWWCFSSGAKIVQVSGFQTVPGRWQKSFARITANSFWIKWGMADDEHGFLGRWRRDLPSRGSTLVLFWRVITLLANFTQLP